MNADEVVASLLQVAFPVSLGRAEKNREIS